MEESGSSIAMDGCSVWQDNPQLNTVSLNDGSRSFDQLSQSMIEPELHSNICDGIRELLRITTTNQDTAPAESDLNDGQYRTMLDNRRRILTISDSRNRARDLSLEKMAESETCVFLALRPAPPPTISDPLPPPQRYLGSSRNSSYRSKPPNGPRCISDEPLFRRTVHRWR